jgi:1-acyl-sn-glycerol-3-phosphate acyltransferase
MNHVLRYLWFILVCRPLVFLLLGLNVRRYQSLIAHRPAILVANHNSHLDTIVLMTIFPLKLLRHIRPVAAVDYVLKNRLLAWFAERIMGIVPLERAPKPGSDPLAACSEALAQNRILILFPEGTRGEPERLQKFKRGIEHLAKRHPDVPVIPVYLHGLGKALPKGEILLVPFFCDVFVGEPILRDPDAADFMATLDSRMTELSREGGFPAWE